MIANRLTKTLVTGAAIAAMAIPAVAQAKQGADDPAGHVRQAVTTTTAKAPGAAAKKKADDNGRGRHRHRHGRRQGVRRADDNSVRRQGRGADDVTPEVRGGGADDGPNHT
jgi:hypothetical protein